MKLVKFQERSTLGGGNAHRFLWHRRAVRCGTKSHLEEFVGVGDGFLYILPELRVIAGVQDGSPYTSTHKQDTGTDNFAYRNAVGGEERVEVT